VGEHIRLPRRYRGRDIQYWMHVSGLLGQGYLEVDDLERVRNLPSPQLSGHPDYARLDVNALAARGVTIVGRLVGVQGSTAQFSGSLAHVLRMADLKQQRLLRGIDAWIERCAADEYRGTVETPEPTRLLSPSPQELSLHGIATVIWATGFRPDYSWLQVPVLDRKGRLRHDGGVTPAAGLYAMGLPFMRRRKSAFLFGVGEDARDIARHLAADVRARYRSSLLALHG
jgi:putative flavoprotein involved in K+ transport